MRTRASLSMDEALLARMTGSLGDGKTITSIGAALAEALRDVLKTRFRRATGISLKIEFDRVEAGTRAELLPGFHEDFMLCEASVESWCQELIFAVDGTLDFDALAFSRENPAPRTVLYLADGTAAVELPADGLGDQSLRLDTPAGTLFLQRPGLYRLDLEGNILEIQAFSGLAELPAGAGSTLLRGGQQARAGGGTWITRALNEPRDDFWRWVMERRRPVAPSRTAEQVGSRVASRGGLTGWRCGRQVDRHVEIVEVDQRDTITELALQDESDVAHGDQAALPVMSRKTSSRRPRSSRISSMYGDRSTPLLRQLNRYSTCAPGK